MTADDRTPDTREVRAMYDAGSNLYRETPEQHYLGAPAPDYGAEFDRFLARVRRDAARSALDGYADALNRNRSAAVWAWPDFVGDIRDWASTHYPEQED